MASISRTLLSIVSQNPSIGSRLYGSSICAQKAPAAPA